MAVHRIIPHALFRPHEVTPGEHGYLHFATKTECVRHENTVPTSPDIAFHGYKSNTIVTCSFGMDTACTRLQGSVKR